MENGLCRNGGPNFDPKNDVPKNGPKVHLTRIWPKRKENIKEKCQKYTRKNDQPSLEKMGAQKRAQLFDQNGDPKKWPKSTSDLDLARAGTRWGSSHGSNIVQKNLGSWGRKGVEVMYHICSKSQLQLGQKRAPRRPNHLTERAGSKMPKLARQLGLSGVQVMDQMSPGHYRWVNKGLP